MLDRAAADGREVTAVATATLWHCCSASTTAGGRSRRVYCWADSRSAPHAAELRERLDEPAIHARTGCRLHSSYWPAKLAWLRDTQPDTFARVPPGSPRASTSSAACSATPPRASRWPPAPACSTSVPASGTGELAAHLGVEDKLPAIDDSPAAG